MTKLNKTAIQKRAGIIALKCKLALMPQIAGKRSLKPEDNLGAGKKLFWLAGILALVLVLIFATHPTLTLAEGEYGSGFLSGVGGTVLRVIQELALWVFGGAITLILSAHILEWVVNNQTTLIQFNGDFISNGLSVTQGLADALLIIMFVIASFGIIFKYREFEAKKSVVTLVLVAIATRFGTLIVKLMVDIGNVAINTIIGTNAHLITGATWPLFNEALSSAAYGMLGMAGLTAALSIPYLNLVTIAATVASVSSVAASFMGYSNVVIDTVSNATTYLVIKFIVKWIFEIVACYMLSGVYITFILLFLSRIFMISILAVISPLAIMAYALPQTKKFYSQWWNSLFKWTFVGVWTLFFLMLGLGSSGFIIPTNTADIVAGDDGLLAQIIIDQGMLYYLFLIVYLAKVNDMAQSESGVGSLFKSALIGAGAAALTHTIKPAAGSAQKGFSRFAFNKGQAMENMPEGQSPSFADNLMLHGSGFMAKALDEKQLSNYGSMFSGNSDKAQNAAQGLSKSFDITKPKSLSSIDSLMDAEVADVGKDFTVEKIMALGKKATPQQAIWAIKNAKTEDLPALFDNLGEKNSTEALNYAVKHQKITPSAMQTIARNTDMLEKSSALKDKLYDQAKGSTQTTQAVEKFLGTLGTEKNADQQAAEKDLIARIGTLKGATSSREAFEKLPGKVFENDANLKALLLSGQSNMFSAISGTAADEKMRNAARANFEQLAKANPNLVKAIATNPVYHDMIPENIKNSAAQKAAGTLATEKQTIENKFAASMRALETTKNAANFDATAFQAQLTAINNERVAAIKKAEEALRNNEAQALKEIVSGMAVTTAAAQAAMPSVSTTGQTAGQPTGQPSGQPKKPSGGYKKYGD